MWDQGRQSTRLAGLHGRGVGLEEIAAADRPALLERYLEPAPGARPHVPVDRRAPLADFERIAADYPVLHVRAADSTRSR
jgi:hypothetical protein